MGYLNKETITVDAILTKRGRELLAAGNNAFNITQFAVADDEVDYSLYNTAHPLGTQYYGAAIENMPIVEASPSTALNLKSKLVTLAAPAVGSVQNRLPRIVLAADGAGAFDLTTGEVAITLSPGNPIAILKFVTKIGDETSTSFDTAAAGGYIAQLYDSSVASISAAGGGTQPGDSSDIMTRIGSEFTVTRNNTVSTTTNTIILITGRTSGATLIVNLTVSPSPAT